MRALRFAALATLLLAGLFGPHPVRGEEWCLDADEVRALVIEDTVYVFHDAALYNCCPEPFEYDIALEGSTISVREHEVLENPCYCVCCYNLYAQVLGVPPGSYVLEFRWFDYESADWQVRLLDLVVPDARQEESLAIGESGGSGCLTEADVPDPEPPVGPASGSPTWSAIKALFR